MQKRGIIIFSLSLVLLASMEFVLWHKLKDAESAASRTDKAYVAVENAGDIAVVSLGLHRVIKRISLTLEQSPSETRYMPHNVQVSPKGDQVWVTGNAMSGNGSNMKMSWLKRLLFPAAYAHGDEKDEMGGIDQVIVIDANRDQIIRRIDIGQGLHLAHVVLTPDGRYALVTAQTRGAVYKIDTATFKVEQLLETPKDGQPHGLRVSPDGATAYIAMMGSKSLGVLDIASFQMSYVPLSGPAVQAGVSPDGKYAFATVYDKKSVAIYDTLTKSVRYVALPAESKGPLQLYPTPDSRYVYVADQGYYFDQPQGSQLYKIDVAQRKVVGMVKLGSAPHGVVVSPDGNLVLVTNVLSNDLSVLDAATNRELYRIPVGSMPNGVSMRTKFGGTP